MSADRELSEMTVEEIVAELGELIERLAVAANTDEAAS